MIAMLSCTRKYQQNITVVYETVIRPRSNYVDIIARRVSKGGSGGSGPPIAPTLRFLRVLFRVFDPKYPPHLKNHIWDTAPPPAENPGHALEYLTRLWSPPVLCLTRIWCIYQDNFHCMEMIFIQTDRDSAMSRHLSH